MITPTITAQQREAIARVLVSFRPGERHWTLDACMTALTEAEAITDDPLALAIAAMRAARDPGVVTPKVIPKEGRHWEGAPHAPKAAVEPEPFRCRCGDVGGHGGPCRQQPTSSRTAEYVAAARATVQAAKLRLAEDAGVPAELVEGQSAEVGADA